MQKGDVVFHQGERGHAFYIILSGVAEIFKQPLRDAVGQLLGQRVASLEAGDAFCELALIDPEKRRMPVSLPAAMCSSWQPLILASSEGTSHRRQYGESL